MTAASAAQPEIPRTVSPTPTVETADPLARPSCAPAAGVLAALPLRDKLAQLLMVGVTGADDARNIVNTEHVGGIFVGSWTDLSMFNDGALQQISTSSGPLPLSVSVDEEGGRVSRLSSLIGPSPSARELTAHRSVDEVYRLALDRGGQMRRLGISIDFAPVVDVTDAADDTVIGDRSFSADPGTVITYAGAYARGLRDSGILPVLKHFPGHGHASGDSHKVGVSTPPLADLILADLVPYKSLLTERPVGVMIGHMQVPGLTGNEPASLSRAAIDLLRGGTGYGATPFVGPIFTDDLSSMRAITDRYGVPEAVLKALKAGADTALWITTDQVPAVLDRLQSAIAAGDLPIASVEASLRRVAEAKAFSSGCAS
ncbi:MAG: glycoside hydrolase family 3 protein [Mycolicibacterium cosmeticum]|nr:glycoside hydrolase family 3 protein [Mycolicibacterium cosmeticum]